MNAEGVAYGTGTSPRTRTCRVLPAGAHERRLVHRQQLPGADPARTSRSCRRFLDGGGRLLMSGQDILDQAAGTTAFVHDYLHVDWDGTETQNDKATAGCTASPATR